MESPAVPSVVVSDALLFADPDTFILVDLAQGSQFWTDAIVLATPFWESSHGKLNQRINLRVEMSPLEAASVCFDPDRRVDFLLEDLEALDPNNEGVLALVRRIKIGYTRQFLSVIKLMPQLVSITSYDFNPRYTHLPDLAFLEMLPSLETLRLKECMHLASLAGPMPQTLRILLLVDCPSLADVSALGSASSLHRLEITKCPKLADLTPLASLNRLTYIIINNLHPDFAFLEMPPSLETLKLEGCKRLASLAGPMPRTLRTLFLVDCPSLADVSALGSASSLRTLGVTKCPKLNLSRCSQLTDITPLAHLTKLDSLNLSHSDELFDVSPLSSLTALTYLNLSHCSRLADVSPLANLSQLRTLGLKSCKELSDFSPLSSLLRTKVFRAKWL